MATAGVIVINGPRGVGKTTAADAIKGERGDIIVLSVMTPFKQRVLVELGLDPAAYFDVFEMLKDSPFPELGGRTPRQIYIERGDAARAADPYHFSNAWAKSARLYTSIGFHVVMTDCRFAQEFYASLETVLPRDVLLMRLKNPAKADPWAGDIGSWFETVPLGQREMTIVNDADLGFFKLETAHFGRSFVYGRKEKR